MHDATQEAVGHGLVLKPYLYFTVFELCVFQI